MTLWKRRSVASHVASRAGTRIVIDMEKKVYLCVFASGEDEDFGRAASVYISTHIYVNPKLKFDFSRTLEFS